MKKLSYILLLFITMVSCTDLDDVFMDRIPFDQFPENETQAALMITPVYKPMQDFVDGGGWWFAQEVTSDAVVCPTRHTDWDDGGKWVVLHNHTWTSETEAIASMWSRFYRGIAEANRLIELFEPNAAEPAAAINIAKLKVLRAFYYYLLIDNYGSVPFVTEFANAEQQPNKTDRAVIFNSIVDDIVESIPLIESSTSKTAVTKGLAYSILAKLYLNAEVYSGEPTWDLAEQACQAIIDLNIYSLDPDPMSPFITNNDNSSENIFVIPFDEDEYHGFNLHMRTLHYNHNLTYNMSVGPWNGFAATEQHYNTFSEDDKRKDYFIVGPQFSNTGQPIIDIVVGPTSHLNISPIIPALIIDASYSGEQIRWSGARVKKFEIRIGAKENLSNDFPLFRYADILLMMAEAQLRQEKAVNVPDIATIRTRAGLPVAGGWGNLDELLAERGRELFWEAHRRQDLIRFGKFNQAWWEKEVSSPDRNTFPIPQWAVDSNPNLAK